jgi:hypothetical protein
MLWREEREERECAAGPHWMWGFTTTDFFDKLCSRFSSLILFDRHSLSIVSNVVGKIH